MCANGEVHFFSLQRENSRRLDRALKGGSIMDVNRSSLVHDFKRKIICMFIVKIRRGGLVSEPVLILWSKAHCSTVSLRESTSKTIRDLSVYMCVYVNQNNLLLLIV